MCLRCGCGRTSIEIFDVDGIKQGDFLHGASSAQAVAAAGAPKRKRPVTRRGRGGQTR